MVPSVLSACGLHAVEFRIVAACRDGSLRLARRGWTETKTLAQLPAQPVAMTINPDNASITIALMNQTLQCFSKKVALQDCSFAFNPIVVSLVIQHSLLS